MINSHKHLNEYFDILKNERRRLTIRILTEMEEVTVSELSELIASVEYGKDPERLTSDERKRVYTSMSQVHIPKLEDCGVVRYDRHKIEPTKKNEELARYLHQIEEDQKPVLQWLFLFATSSVVLATVASVLFFWVGVAKSGNILPVAVGVVISTVPIGFYLICTRLLNFDNSIMSYFFRDWG